MKIQFYCFLLEYAVREGQVLIMFRRKDPLYLYNEDYLGDNFASFILSMSAIDFHCSVDKVQGVDGKDRVVITFDGKYLPYSEQVSLFYLHSRF